jgi:hypothetical protein
VRESRNGPLFVGWIGHTQWCPIVVKSIILQTAIAVVVFLVLHKFVSTHWNFAKSAQLPAFWFSAGYAEKTEVKLTLNLF